MLMISVCYDGEDTLTLWPIGQPTPCRIIFFDDEIESIHRLNDEGATAIRELEIAPVRESVITKDALVRLSRTLSERVQKHGGNIQTRRRVLSELSNGLWFPGAEDYLPALWPLSCPLQHAKTCIAFFPERVKDNLLEWSDSALRRWENLEKEHRPLIAEHLRYSDTTEIVEKLNGGLHIGQLIPNALQFSIDAGETLRLKGADFTPSQRDLKDWIAKDWKLNHSIESNRRKRIESLLKNREIETQQIHQTNPSNGMRLSHRW